MRSSPPARLLFTVVTPLRAFVRTEAAASLWLLAATLATLALTSSAHGAAWQALWASPLRLSAGPFALATTARDALNEGAMTLFFLTAGLELKRALAGDELRSARSALLPVLGALGGMALPALLFALCNGALPLRRGWGIPMATDLAFSLGCLTLLRRRVPSGLVVFLMALAIFDDLGAMLVIALFYGGRLSPPWLALCLALVAALFSLGRYRVRSPLAWTATALALWFALHRAGLHATMAGVVWGLCLPASPLREPSEALSEVRHGAEALETLYRRGHRTAGALDALLAHLESLAIPVDRWQRALHGAVAWGVVPLFALANAGLDLRAVTAGPGAPTVAWGVVLGLSLGKPLGIVGAVALGAKLLRAELPSGATARSLLGVAMLAGIGFTMSLFVATLAYGEHPAALASARVGVLGGSALSALLGLAVLRTLPLQPAFTQGADEPDEREILLPHLAHGWRLQLWQVRGALVGRSLAGFGLRSRFDVTALGRRVEGDALQLEALDPELALREGEWLLLAGTDDALERFVAAHNE